MTRPKNTDDALPIPTAGIPIGPVVPGTGATNLGKASGQLFVAGDVGVLGLVVRNDAGGPLVGDGRYSPAQTDATGAVRVTVAGAGSSSVSGTVANDAPAAAVNPVLVGGYASAAAPADVSADNDAVRAWLLRNGSTVVNLASGGTLVTLGQKLMASSLPVVIASDQTAVPVSGTVSLGAGVAAIGSVTVSNAGGGSAVNIQDGGNSITVDGSVAVSNIVQIGGVAPSALADDESATPTAPRVGAVLMGMDALGQANVDRARLAKVHDVDSDATTIEYAIGVSLRTPASGGSVAFGTATAPVRIDPTGTTEQPVLDKTLRRIMEQMLLETAINGLNQLEAAGGGPRRGYELRGKEVLRVS